MTFATEASHKHILSHLLVLNIYIKKHFVMVSRIVMDSLWYIC